MALTKLELVERAVRWAGEKGVEFDLGLLSEWIDAGLVNKGERGKNVGKRPVYRYGCHNYRRVLQVLKLYSRGIKGTDQILIMLFLNGRGVRPYEVREPLQREFSKARAKLNALARSPRFDQNGPIPPKHKESLVQSLGPLDNRFIEAGFAFLPDHLIEAMRAARSPDPDSIARKFEVTSEHLFLNFLKFTFGGLLSEDPEFESEIDAAIANASNAQLEFARSVIVWNRDLFSILEKCLDRSAPARASLDAFLVSFSQPEFVCSQFALMLRRMSVLPMHAIDRSSPN